ncbi:MAG: hypothetical protein IPM39_19250 [Chloroflexi bacterium]|nr:hypothetical protein [Chloroflexota bacterium]
MWEAYNELGSLYGDWANFCRKNQDWVQAQTNYHSSLTFQSKAVAVAQSHGLHWQLVDTYDDLAQLYAEWGNTKESSLQLRYGLQVISQRQEVSNELAPNWPSGEAYWLVLGKAHLQQGMWLLEQSHSNSVQGITHLIKAAYCFYHYWPGIPSYDPRQSMIKRLLQQTRVTEEALHQQVEQVANEWNKSTEDLLHLFVGFT